MCGITAIIGKQDTQAIEAMLEVASRRGPEDQRIAILPGATLGQARLGFVDTENNIQPLVRGEDFMIYNGEIYNWESLNTSHGLGAKNDTELLLNGMARYTGSELETFLSELDGQYAFVGRAGGNIIAGRDRWGICPLVYGVKDGAIYFGSTPETVEAAGIAAIHRLDAGTYSTNPDADNYGSSFNMIPAEAGNISTPEGLLEASKNAVLSRIPTGLESKLWTAMGGMDSQFITKVVAEATHGNFGGAVTVVPWIPSDPFNMELGDYKNASSALEELNNSGVAVNHIIAQLNPEYVREALGRVIKVLGPDYFNICCGLAEDLVATTVRNAGGKAVMTAGGPDEAMGYMRFAKTPGLNEKVAGQFAYSEGVRAGLILGEHGLENRVPLADMILWLKNLPLEAKLDLEKGREKKIWREALEGYLPEETVCGKKETVHGSTGAKLALYDVAANDSLYLAERAGFAGLASAYGWDRMVNGGLDDGLRMMPSAEAEKDPAFMAGDMVREGQLYCLYRWSRLEPDNFTRGFAARYDPGDMPLTHDWILDG